MKKCLIALLIVVMALLAVGCSKEHAHALTKVQGIAATCTSTGVKDYWTCSGCNKIFQDANATKEFVKDNTLPKQLTIPMKDHVFTDDKDCTTDDKCKTCTAILPAEHAKHEAKADDGDCTTAVTCKYCAVVLVEKKEHTGGTADCTNQAKCTTCGKAYGALDVDAHDYSDVHGCFSDDFNTCTIAGECARCANKVYEVVGTTYKNGTAVAVFSIPGFPAQVVDLTNPNRFSASVYHAALTYMIANGESDIEVMFPVLKSYSGPVYSAVRNTAKWYLEGAVIPEEIPNTVNAIQALIAKLPF